MGDMKARLRVGTQELRRHLGVYLKRVSKGETLEITVRGKAVALLSPIQVNRTASDRLIAEGRMTPRTDDLLRLGPPPGRPSGRLSDALKEQRADRL
jgi:prevent-host-death family protein